MIRVIKKQSCNLQQSPTYCITPRYITMPYVTVYRKISKICIVDNGTEDLFNVQYDKFSFNELMKVGEVLGWWLG